MHNKCGGYTEILPLIIRNYVIIGRNILGNASAECSESQLENSKNVHILELIHKKFSTFENSRNTIRALMNNPCILPVFHSFLFFRDLN